MQERLQKILAARGVASRRQAEVMILAGRVSVNGRIVDALGEKADSNADEIRVDGQLLRASKLLYFLFHKPRGVVTTLKDPQGRPSLETYLASLPERLYPVGRLDYSSEGLLLLTNDGELTNRLLHPRYHVPKTYRVVVTGRLGSAAIQVFQQGVQLSDGMTAPAKVQYVRFDAETGQTTFELTIREGKNRQIRRMCDAIKLPVVRLIRLSLSFLKLDGISPGRMRPLTPHEVQRLRKEAGLNG